MGRALLMAWVVGFMWVGGCGDDSGGTDSEDADGAACGDPTGVCAGGASGSNTAAACTPNCAGRICGSDGCGGSCGGCGSGEACTSAGQCMSQETTDEGCPLDTACECQSNAWVCLGSAAPPACTSAADCADIPGTPICIVDTGCVPLCTNPPEGQECGGDSCPSGAECMSLGGNSLCLPMGGQFPPSCSVPADCDAAGLPGASCIADPTGVLGGNICALPCS